jgi:hypothetical protein
MGKLGIRVLTLLVVVFCVAQAAWAQPVPIRIGSIADSRFGTGWTLDGSEMANTRAKLLNSSNFGASGTVPRSIVITDTGAAEGSVNAALLSTIDVFFIGYLNDSSINAFTPSEIAAFQAWVNAGGTMIITCDSPTQLRRCAPVRSPGDQRKPASTHRADISRDGRANLQRTLLHGPASTWKEPRAHSPRATGRPFLLTPRRAPLRAGVCFSGLATAESFMDDVDLLANGASDGAAITTPNDQFVGNVFAFGAACSGTGLCLGNSRFWVTADWATTTSSGHGTAVPLTPDTGYFWFFGSSNVEMVVKALDGCGITGHKWVFAGGLTNVHVTMTVTDLQTGASKAVKTYINPQGTAFQPIQDTGAFATCP